MTDLANLSSGMFAGQLHSIFRFALPDRPEPLEMELVDHREGPQSTDVEQFAIVFSGPGEPILPQGTYPVAHNELGSFELFVVPIGRRSGHLLYEAVFSRLLDRELASSTPAAKDR